MSDELKSVGEIAKALPKEGLNKLLITVCETFERTVAPLTAATAGLGELIQARFQRLTSLEKINTAAILERAKAKIDASGLPLNPDPDLKVIVAVIENGALETNEDLQKLWANLLAAEFTAGKVTPLYADFLRKMMPEDAKALEAIAISKPKFIRNFGTTTVGLYSPPTLVPEAVNCRLLALGLTGHDSQSPVHYVTYIGWRFMQFVMPELTSGQ